MEYLGDDAAAYKTHLRDQDQGRPQGLGGSDPPVQGARTRRRRRSSRRRWRRCSTSMAALKFLALDVALVNSDGFWSRASDYSIYQDEKGRFHVIPHDMNEASDGGGCWTGGRGRRARRLRAPPGRSSRLLQMAASRPAAASGGGRGFGPGGGGAGSRSAGRAGRHQQGAAVAAAGGAGAARALPGLRARTSPRSWLDWKKLEPIVRERQALIADGREGRHAEAVYHRGVHRGRQRIGGQPAALHREAAARSCLK